LRILNARSAASCKSNDTRAGGKHPHSWISSSRAVPADEFFASPVPMRKPESPVDQGDLAERLASSQTWQSPPGSRLHTLVAETMSGLTRISLPFNDHVQLRRCFEPSGMIHFPGCVRFFLAVAADQLKLGGNSSRRKYQLASEYEGIVPWAFSSLRQRKFKTQKYPESGIVSPWKKDGSGHTSDGLD